MRILIVAATAAEIAPLQQRPDVEILITGVGMVAAAARTSAALARTRYDLALNLGICGSFDRALSLGTVVHVVSDGIPELGAEDGDTFLSIDELGLLRGDAPPFSNGRLVNAAVPVNPVLKCLPAVHGITVNTVHGNERSIAATVRRFAPQIESMEGAGFMYACLIQAVPFAQVRAVSNMVERRNRSAWKIDEAIASLCRVAADLIESV
jgi:futalosine hydrolase